MQTYRIVVGVDGSDAAMRALDWAVAEAARAPYPRVAVSTEAIPGPAADVLVHTATDADLLVLGSHGHGGLFHAVPGSVAEACIRAAVCPVVVIPVPRVAGKPAEPITPISGAVR